MKLYLQSIVTILSLINPIICGAIFRAAEQGRSPSERLKDASMASISILLILCAAALFGIHVLDAFGISLDVFSMAGGAVLVWMGFSLLRSATAPKSEQSSLAKLVVFAASPGTIAGVIAIAVAHTGRELPVTALVGVLAATLATWVVMLVPAKEKSGNTNSGFVHATIQSFMGLIVMTLGLQIGLKGMSVYFNLAVN